MTWLAPGYLVAGFAAAMVVVALHLLAWRRPPVAVLPTARFVPDSPARARASATRPADRALLVVRVLALLLAAAALARPVHVATRAPLARVIVADLSASTGEAAIARAAVRAAWRPGDAIVVLDTGVRLVQTPDSLPSASSRAPRAGRLSAAFIRADDAARALATVADSVELVLVTPLLREETDAASAMLARAWPGRARHVPAAAVASDTVTYIPDVDAPEDDPVAAGVLAAALRSPVQARLVRREALAADSAWISAASGRVIVAWPRHEAPPGAREAALAWEADAALGPYAPEGAPSPGVAVLRWADGTPAASERAVGAGCMRDVRIAVPAAGDATLAPAFGRLLARLVAPCGGPRDLARVEPAALGLRDAIAARALRRPAPADPWRLARWPLAVALALLLAEPLLRRGAATGREVTRSAQADAARPEAA